MAKGPSPGRPVECPRVLIVADNASARFGGEASLPLHYFRVLRQRGHDVILLVHARTRAELTTLFPGDDTILFIEDDWIDRLLFRAGHYLPARVEVFTTGLLMHFHAQSRQRKWIRQLIRDRAIDIVHQPTPVSPRGPSLLFGLGAPVVIGPMNGNMSFPPAFRQMDNVFVRITEHAARSLAFMANRLLPGKRQAAVLLVANARTQAGLPWRGGKVIEFVENGVDFSVWRQREADEQPSGAATRFVYMGRLVDWKAVDLLLQAFAGVATGARAGLTIVGDGGERPRLEQLARDLGLWSDTPREGCVWFAGWRSQVDCADILASADALVLPSLRECGGAVVLEAMAMGKPVVATDWGGPADYLDETCGILIEPSSRHAMIEGFRAAMVRLARSVDERTRLGAAGQQKARAEFDWETKVDRMIAIYNDVVAGAEKRP